MNSDNHYRKTRVSNYASYSGNYLKYRKFMDGLAKDIDSSMPKHLKECLLESSVLLPEGSQACIELVLDTSVLLKQIMGELKGSRSSLLDMVDSGFLTLFSPPKLETEVMEKIEEKLPESKRVWARESAKRILNTVTIVDDIDRNVNRTAEKLLGQRDPEDVVFLAVTFQKQVHGILTADKDFVDITNLRVWRIGDLGKIVAGLRQGSTVIWIFTKGLPTAFILLSALVGLIVDSIISLGRILYFVGKSAVSYTFDKIKQIPPIVMVLITLIAILAFALSEDLRRAAEEGFERVTHWIIDTSRRLVETLNQLGGLVKSSFLFLVSEAPKVLDLIGYLAYDIVNMVGQLNSLESKRATLPEPSSYEKLMEGMDRIVASLRTDLKEILANTFKDQKQ